MTDSETRQLKEPGNESTMLQRLPAETELDQSAPRDLLR